MFRRTLAPGALAAYLPRLQLDRVLGRRRGGGSPQETQDLDAAMLLVDLAGFSAAATELSARGAQGTEELSQAVIPLFAALTETIDRHGGDVLYYAGDAVAAVFPSRRDLPLEMATLQATTAALACQQVTGERARPANFTLRLRASVSCGRTRVFEAGGTDGRWLLFVVGPAVDDLALTDQGSVPGRVALSSSAYALIGARVQATVQPNGLAFVEAVHQPAPPAPLPDFDLGEAATELERMVPPPIAARVTSGIRTPIFEFRQVTVVFTNMTRTTHWTGDQFTRAQLGIAACQQAVIQAGGMVLNVIGDKGLGLISLFGAPSMSREDDAARALDAALEQHRKLGALGISSAIGVASGPVLCAEHENQVRHGFDAVGSTLVLAARLMQQAGNDGILCCRQTARLAERFGHRVEALPAVSLKGFRQAVAPFRPVGRSEAPQRGDRARFGREPELARLDAALTCLVDQADSPNPAPAEALWLEGEAGIGKTTLLQHVKHAADAVGLRAVHGIAESREVNTPYFALRSVLASLAGLDGTENQGQTRTRVLDWLARSVPELYGLSPLIDSILPLELTETEQTALLQGTARAERLVDLVVALFQHETLTTPLLVTFEDLHWSTDEVWDILRKLLEQVPRLLIVATLRPLDRERTLLNTHGQHVRLQGLDLEGTSALLAAQFGVDKVPEALGRMVHERSEGNPFFTEEIARSLVEAEAVQVHMGRVDLMAGLDVAALPQTVAGVLTARLDRLALSTQTILKTASVVGRSFTRRALEAVLAEQALGAHLDETLDELVRLRFLTHEEQAGDRWTFRHALVQDTVYSLLPFAHSRPLHRAVAEYLESQHPVDRSSVTALLAYHWTQADEPKPAAAYSALAGQQALNAYASDACINHMERALELDTRVRGPLKRDIQRATWARALAEAWYSVPRLDKAQHWYEQSWVLAGWSPP